MPFPQFLKPIPVRFLTDYARKLQMNSLSGSLKGEANDLIHAVVYREQIDESVSTAIDNNNRYEQGERNFEPETDADPLLNTLEHVVNGIMTGQSLDDQHGKIRQYIHNQQERSDLISNLLLTKDYQRLLSHLKVREILEARLLQAALRGDLNTSELLAVTQMVTEQTSKLETRVQAGASNVSDVMALLNKADYALSLHEDKVRDKFKHTTSTGREIVRRMIHKLRKVDGAPEPKKK
jgi:hypothetical protein